MRSTRSVRDDRAIMYHGGTGHVHDPTGHVGCVVGHEECCDPGHVGRIEVEDAGRHAIAEAGIEQIGVHPRAGTR